MLAGRTIIAVSLYSDNKGYYRMLMYAYIVRQSPQSNSPLFLQKKIMGASRVEAKLSAA